MKYIYIFLQTTCGCVVFFASCFLGVPKVLRKHSTEMWSPDRQGFGKTMLGSARLQQRSFLGHGLDLPPGWPVANEGLVWYSLLKLQWFGDLVVTISGGGNSKALIFVWKLQDMMMIGLICTFSSISKVCGKESTRYGRSLMKFVVMTNREVSLDD